MNKLVFMAVVTAGFTGNLFAADKAVSSLWSEVSPSVSDNLIVPAPIGARFISEDGLSSDRASKTLSDLKAAVKAADIPALTDMGHSFWIAVYPKNVTFKKILSDATGNNESDIDLKNFHMATGDKAARTLAKALRDAAKDEAEDPQNTLTPKLIRAVADAAEKAFTGTQNFTRVQLAEHYIAEDGDLESHTIVGQQRDGTQFALIYTDFPF